MLYNESVKSVDRRSFLISLLGGGSLCLIGLTCRIRNAVAMGSFKYPTGVQKLKGKVFINDRPAKEGDLVKPGDTVATGPESMVIFVVNKSVYLLRDNTRVDLQREVGVKDKAAIEVLRIIKGKVLMVFKRKQRKRLVTQTAIAGVRGSAVYIEAEPVKTYICVCYGKADLETKDDSEIRETVHTNHHESPRFIFGPNRRDRIIKAPVLNHTDAELMMLEAMVGRRPPFAYGYNDY